MKVVAILLVIATVAFAQHMHDPLHDPDDAFHEMVHQEARAIMAQNPNVTVADCTSKCDNLLGFLVAASEKLSDDLCEHACRCEITITNCEHDMGGHDHDHDHPHP